MSGPRARLGVLLVALVMGASGCRGEEREAHAAALTGGDPARGRTLIRHYGCGSCHAIPGVAGATATVGPPLGGIASRGYIGGVLQNSPGNMMMWIRDPRAVDPHTAMPRLGVTSVHARDITAYLYTLH